MLTKKSINAGQFSREHSVFQNCRLIFGKNLSNLSKICNRKDKRLSKSEKLTFCEKKFIHWKILKIGFWTFKLLNFKTSFYFALENKNFIKNRIFDKNEKVRNMVFWAKTFWCPSDGLKTLILNLCFLVSESLTQ